MRQTCSSTGDVRAAIYVRMSTESQNYSTNHQRAAITAFADRAGLRIVKEFADEGKSGLDIKRRAGLLALIAAVQSGQAGFEVIIVYDISRWGRFQDTDEAAYHEHTCRRAGIKVVYCAEQFDNDGSPLSALIKSMKRTMAAEYSRELSEKVFQAQCRFIEMGYKQGGSAGLGFRRLAVTADGMDRRILTHGEQKGAVTDRVLLVLGPQSEGDLVKRIYRLYVDDSLSDMAIARLLNAEGAVGEYNRTWTPTIVCSILTNVKYRGTLAYNRRSQKLAGTRAYNLQNEWVMNDGAIECLIAPALFAQAQAERARRGRRYHSGELVDMLRKVQRVHGRVTADLIEADSTMPSAQVFKRCFGSLIKAYQAAGIPTPHAAQSVSMRRQLETLRGELYQQVLDLAKKAGAQVKVSPFKFMVTLNDDVVVQVNVAARNRPKQGRPNWAVRARAKADFVICARADVSGSAVLDYFLIPTTAIGAGSLRLKDPHPLFAYEAMRFGQVEQMFGLVLDVTLGA